MKAAECGPGRQSWTGMRVRITAYLLQGPPIAENKSRRIERIERIEHVLLSLGPKLQAIYEINPCFNCKSPTVVSCLQARPIYTYAQLSQHPQPSFAHAHAHAHQACINTRHGQPHTTTVIMTVTVTTIQLGKHIEVTFLCVPCVPCVVVSFSAVGKVHHGQHLALWYADFTLRCEHIAVRRV
jgi:hypothetical protein